MNEWTYVRHACGKSWVSENEMGDISSRLHCFTFNETLQNAGKVFIQF